MTDATTTAAADTSQATTTTATTASADTKTADAKTADTTATTATTAAPDWRTFVTKSDLKEHAGRFASVDDLVQANLDARKKLSSAINVPGKDAKPEEIADYRKKIGIPDTADGYKFTMLDGKEPSEGDKAFQKKMAETFHGANITAEQAGALNKVWNEHVSAMQTAIVEADKQFAAATEAALKKEWGADFDANKTFANRAISTLFGSELEGIRKIEGKDGRFILDRPEMVKAFAKIGREMGEDGLKGALSADARATLDDEIATLNKQFHDAHGKGDYIERDRIEAKRRVLYQRRHPGMNAPEGVF